MDEKYQKKLQTAKLAYNQIISLMQSIQGNSEFEIGFCWDECLWVDDEFFTFSDLCDINV